MSQDGQTAIITKQGQLQMYFVPEPSTCIMTLGLFGLLLHSRPRRVACA
ncbi:MAG: PEP-CTERM sorting domain-containing protein [Planctomycetales bacterium]|nr:PEP-CTERM sorting domain-containing protein [Planctomycetales bacterium]